MPEVAYATLGVIPSVKGLRAELEKQTATFDQAGRAGGRRYGDAVASGASSRLKSGLKAAIAPAAGILAGLGGAKIFGDMIAEAQEAAKVGRITEQLIKSTGGSANLSAGQVNSLANSLSKYAAVDDELIQAGANVMLTFRNVRNEAGKGNDVFSRATKAALDLSTVLGTDMKTSALQLGKALNDPVKGMMLLGRAGVQFTADQKAQVKALVANNDLLGAQKLILHEIETQVGGAAGANATALDRLNVSFKNLEEAAGTAAAPALNKLATVATNNLIPALQDTGGLIGDAAGAFGKLPGPVKAAAGAFVAFRIAAATGLGSTLASGAAAAGSAMSTLRLKAMLAADAYRAVAVSSEGASVGNARLAGSFAAVRVASEGAGTAMVRGLKGSLALVGGPWGAALLAGTAVLAHFWGEHQKAKARVEEFTAAIKADSGALKDNTRQAVVNELEKEGILKTASKLGISLETVTQAALGNKNAVAALNSALQGFKTQAANAADAGASNGQEMQANVLTAQKLIGSVLGVSGAVSDSRAAYQRQASAMGESATAQDHATQATESYTSKIDAARDAVRKLLDIENKRRNANLTIRQDRLALVEQLQAAREQAAKGTGTSPQAKAATITVQNAQLAYSRAVKAHGAASTEAKIADEKLTLAQNKLATASASFGKTLDINTKAGQENLQALYDLANQWNNSAQSVKNAKGAYRDFRQQFINIAMSMGDTKKQAETLANQIVNVPRRIDTKVSTPGMKGALRDLKELRDQLAAIHNFKGARVVISAQATKNRNDPGRFATGGAIYGPGTGTSDSIFIRASSGEFMQRKAAVDYYGVDFMRRLNALQVPKFANGGPVGTTTSAPLGSEVIGKLRIVGDVGYLEGVARPTEATNRRLSALDGVRRP